jgi:hypothetical protein
VGFQGVLKKTDLTFVAKNQPFFPLKVSSSEGVSHCPFSAHSATPSWSVKRFFSSRKFRKSNPGQTQISNSKTIDPSQSRVAGTTNLLEMSLALQCRGINSATIMAVTLQTKVDKGKERNKPNLTRCYVVCFRNAIIAGQPSH